MNAVVQKVRESNFELLRIFAMFLIVLHHCVAHGVFYYWSNNVSSLDYINNFLAILTASGGQVGVTIFVLLCGYFSCQQEFRLSKWFKIYLKMLFVSLLIFGLWLFIDEQQASMWVDVSLFPFTHNAYWFVCDYLVLYSFMPLLNILLQKVPKKMIQNYLIWSAVVLIVIPFLGLRAIFSDMLYFLFLYILGGSIKLNYISLKGKFFTWLFSISILSVLFFIFKRILTTEDGINLWGFYSYYTGLNTVYTLCVSLLLFRLFSNLKINSQWINWFAASAFGIYLLHNNELVRPYLWHTLLGMHRTMSSPFFVLWALLVSAGVFGVCLVLDKMLSVLYEPFIQITIELGKKIYKKIDLKKIRLLLVK